MRRRTEASSTTKGGPKGRFSKQKVDLFGLKQRGEFTTEVTCGGPRPEMKGVLMMGRATKGGV